MTVRVADARKNSKVIVSDSRGQTQEVIYPSLLKVGFPGNLSSLILLGGLKIATKTVTLGSSTSTTYNIQQEDFLVNVQSSRSQAVVNLPENPKLGQAYVVHDKAGMASVYPITIFPKSGYFIDEATNLAIRQDFGSAFVVWEGTEWVNLLTSSLVSSTSSTSSLLGVAENLSGLRWELPSILPLQPSPTRAPCDNGTGVRTLMGGFSQKLYNVTLRFRGEVELSPYISGSATGTNGYHAGTFDPSGAVLSTVRNTYMLFVSDPSDYWFLNRFVPGGDTSTRTFAIDFTMTIQIRGQASVALIAQERPRLANGAGDNSAMAANVDAIVITNVDPYPAAYDGQFIQMDVIDVTYA